jgi:hypothetical protein
MNLCPNTSITFDCKGCSLFRSKRREKMKEIIYVYESETFKDELCVIGPSNMESAKNLTDVKDPTTWDCVVLNRDKTVVNISGPRFLVDMELEEAMGKKLDEVLGGNLLRVVLNLVELVMSGKGQNRPLNTMYGRKALTMQAFALNNTEIVGTVVVVCPTKYQDEDLLAFLDTVSTKSTESTESVLPPDPE